MSFLYRRRFLTGIRTRGITIDRTGTFDERIRFVAHGFHRCLVFLNRIQTDQADELLVIGQSDQGHALGVATDLGDFGCARAHEGALVRDQHQFVFFADLHSLKGRLPGLISLTSGRSDSPEQIERGYMHGFVADFTDWTALAEYQAHPDHQRAGAALVAHAVGGIDGILVFDLAVA